MTHTTPQAPIEGSEFPVTRPDPTQPRQGLPTWVRLVIVAVVLCIVGVVAVVVAAMVFFGTVVNETLAEFEDQQATGMLDDALGMGVLQEAVAADTGTAEAVTVRPGETITLGDASFTASPDNTTTVTVTGDQFCVKVTNPTVTAPLYYDSADEQNPTSNEPGGVCPDQPQD